MEARARLDTDSGAQLERRAFVGDRCIALAYDGPWSARESVDEDERETFARDAVSDILTALFGPPGEWVETAPGEWDLMPNRFALNEARRVVESALHSYEGDAEDYCAPKGERS